MKAIDVFNTYEQSLSKGDFETLFSTLSDDIVWHMGGNGPLSGTIVGKNDLRQRFTEFSRLSGGSFRILTEWAADNGDYVTASVVSMAERNCEKLHNKGIDLFRIENGKIREVWTFSEHQSAEDEFWK